MLMIDFETRSRVQLKRTGVAKYAMHPSTVVLCLAYMLDDGPVRLWRPWDPTPKDLWDRISDGDEVHAFNAAFEVYIWKYVMHLRHGWPAIATEQWRCTMANALAFSLPGSLGKCGEALALPIQKDQAGHRVMHRLCKPRKPSKHDKSEWFSDGGSFDTLYHYCERDVEAEHEIHDTLQPLSELEQKVWQLDRRINERGIYIDLDAVHAAIKMVAEHKVAREADLKRVTEGEITTAGQIDRILNYCAKHGANIDNVQAETVAKLLRSPEDLPHQVVEVLKVRQELSKTSTAKFDAFADMACMDGRIREAHQYHAASTGRWGGRGVQLQNIPRRSLEDVDDAVALLKSRDYEAFRTKYPDVVDTLSRLIRPMITAPEGRDLIVCDFAQIEARVVAWEAGQNDLVEDFATEEPVYEKMAGKIYKKDQTDVSKDERSLGKAVILGCGYGMGARKFHAVLDKVGIQVDENFAQLSVDTFREAYPDIVTLWREMGRAAIYCVETGNTKKVGKVKFLRDRKFLYMQLPSRRRLAYYNPSVVTVQKEWGPTKQVQFWGVDSQTKQWKRQETYGAKLVENATQAIARDLLVGAMFRLEAKGYEIVMHVHDEVVTEQDVTFGSVEEVERIMCVSPDWAKGCPVGAEGFRTIRYGKG